ncbi:MAG: hypothetical protein EAZ70_10830 [Runella slithyformis]|nr:MAG: hypothetical protein EAY79_08810 [Runella slithyformis]TAG15990.1 MAG: hypothetical protein EAZ38_19200 [Cytophagales bacterium]TAG40378.1 MAG: hypothetical protein EAZ32_06490 [Cytophagia bacterium]TAF25029.1 MAG: hypothetical protein EAZ70_10830 [Runella slithyformis]TAF79123.1 MAG: hypothetical protein EAZ50_12200 [Runella slithyformis]
MDIHEANAKTRNIAEGDEIKVFNQRGEVHLTARLKNKVRKGVVCSPKVFGHLW